MGTKLSDLTEATALTDADELYVNDGGTSKRITKANLATELGTEVARKQVHPESGGFIALLGGANTDTKTLSGLAGTSSSYFMPFTINREIVISHISQDVVTSQAAATRKTGIYTSVAGVPDTLVTNSAASFDMTTATYVTVAFSGNVTLVPGAYWFGWMSNVAGTAVRGFDEVHGMFSGFVSPGVSIHEDLLMFRNNSGAVYGDWPTTTAGTTTGGGGAGKDPPYVIGTVV